MLCGPRASFPNDHSSEHELPGRKCPACRRRSGAFIARKCRQHAQMREGILPSGRCINICLITVNMYVILTNTFASARLWVLLLPRRRESAADSPLRESRGGEGLPWHFNLCRHSIRDLFSPWLARAAAWGSTARTILYSHREIPRMRSSTSRE